MVVSWNHAAPNESMVVKAQTLSDLLENETAIVVDCIAEAEEAREAQEAEAAAAVVETENGDDMNRSPDRSSQHEDDVEEHNQ